MNRVYYMLMKRQRQYNPIYYTRRHLHSLHGPTRNNNDNNNNDHKIWYIVIVGYILYMRYA